MDNMANYQLVIKKQRAKNFPPFSSPVLLFCPNLLPVYWRCRFKGTPGIIVTPGVVQRRKIDEGYTKKDYVGFLNQTASNYILLKMYMTDNEAVIKKQGVNGILPFSSPVLLFHTKEVRF